MVGGWDGRDTHSEAYVLDLEDPEGGCAVDVADYPINVTYATAALTGGGGGGGGGDTVSVCGGYSTGDDFTGDTNQCYDYDFDSASWIRCAPNQQWAPNKLPTELQCRIFFLISTD